MASITVLKTNGEVSAGIQVSFVWKSNVVPSEDVQLPVPQEAPEAFLLAAGSIGVCIHRFFNTKILADAKEWFASTLFHHISGLQD